LPIRSPSNVSKRLSKICRRKRPPFTLKFDSGDRHDNIKTDGGACGCTTRRKGGGPRSNPGPDFFESPPSRKYTSEHTAGLLAYMISFFRSRPIVGALHAFSPFCRTVTASNRSATLSKVPGPHDAGPYRTRSRRGRFADLRMPQVRTRLQDA
jgi:hypothetical protein